MGVSGKSSVPGMSYKDKKKEKRKKPNPSQCKVNPRRQDTHKLQIHPTANPNT